MKPPLPAFRSTLQSVIVQSAGITADKEWCSESTWRLRQRRGHSVLLDSDKENTYLHLWRHRKAQPGQPGAAAGLSFCCKLFKPPVKVLGHSSFVESKEGRPCTHSRQDRRMIQNNNNNKKNKKTKQKKFKNKIFWRKSDGAAEGRSCGEWS